MSSYKNTTFGNLGSKRQETVRRKVEEMWANGFTAQEISKKVRVGFRSVATAMGNLTRRHVSSSRR